MIQWLRRWFRPRWAKRSCETCKWCEPTEKFRVLDPKDVMGYARCRCPKNRIHTNGDSGDWRWFHCTTHRCNGSEARRACWLDAYLVKSCGPQGRWWEKKLTIDVSHLCNGDVTPTGRSITEYIRAHDQELGKKP
jgi:hypothetical protein